MTTPLRVALFGTGFARDVMLPGLRHVEGVRLAGISSGRSENALDTARAFGIEHASADHREILEKAKPDLVFIVTPPNRHMEMTLDSLSAGCHVVCEKPTALDAGESARMLEAARAHRGRLVLIDHELRFDPRRAALRELVRAGRIGRVLHATYTIHSVRRRDPSVPWTWWSDAAQGGGALGALASHAVDALRSLLGEVESVRGTLHTFTHERPDAQTGVARPVTADDFASAWLRFRSGALASISVSTVEGERAHRITVSGMEGAAVWQEQSPLRLLQGNEARRDAWRELPVPDDLPPSADLGIPDTDWGRSFLRYARAIVQSLREGRAEVPGAATMEDGHRNQLVLDAIRRSSSASRWTAVDDH
jgi:predicted dehydrogenase